MVNRIDEIHEINIAPSQISNLASSVSHYNNSKSVGQLTKISDSSRALPISSSLYPSTKNILFNARNEVF